MPRLLFFVLLGAALRVQAADGTITGRVTDPQGKPVPDARVVLSAGGAAARQCAAGMDGSFAFEAVPEGSYRVAVAAAGLQDAATDIRVTAGQTAAADVQLERAAARREAVTVTADVSQVDVLAPDPAEKVFVSEDLLDANPGRPGAPVSIPGYPIETASSGIKAPQYFAPGVAGDTASPLRNTSRWGRTWCRTICRPMRTAMATPTRIST